MLVRVYSSRCVSVAPPLSVACVASHSLQEGIYRDGRRVGHLTSGGFGPTVAASRAIGMGYVALDATESAMPIKALKEYVQSGSYELEVAGRRVAAQCHWDALYDPTASRMRDVEGANAL